MEDRIKQVMADVLELNKNLIDNKTSIENVNAWDSLKQMNLLIALEEEFDFEFEDDEMTNLISYSRIKNAIAKKIAN